MLWLQSPIYGHLKNQIKHLLEIRNHAPFNGFNFAAEELSSSQVQFPFNYKKRRVCFQYAATVRTYAKPIVGTFAHPDEARVAKQPQVHAASVIICSVSHFFLLQQIMVIPFSFNLFYCPFKWCFPSVNNGASLQSHPDEFKFFTFA
ncbi:hypothetical protein C1H46_028839 [Malus baccata]|uniref:Uncharacterized protein n=1 Tax=Malus baccata TaxID=106549 RepID=A0A540LGS3_MALBA|nr:hypothetical protein C1H46_028839 [Malus baccata]